MRKTPPSIQIMSAGAGPVRGRAEGAMTFDVICASARFILASQDQRVRRRCRRTLCCLPGCCQDGLSHRIGVELLQRRSAMHLDRLDADRENFCDFSVRTPFGDELDHGLPASRQRSLARLLQQEALKQRLRYLAGEEGLM